MEMQKLLATLQELRSTELDLFKWYLQMADNFVGDLIPVTAAALEDATTREKIVTLIMTEYPNDAQEIVMNVLKKIKRHDLVKKFAITPKASGVERPQTTQATGVDKPGITADDPVQSKILKEVKGDQEYKLNSKPTGLCVIMNNENFKNPDNTRKGTDKDAGDLARTFSWLGFRVLMCKDQTKSQMQESLKRFSSKDLTELGQGSSVKEWAGWAFTDLNANDVPQHGDAFVCCIMSHGDEGCVFGTDWGALPIKEITTTFNGQNCSVLVNKPKVFFIQACQDKKRIQPGVAADSIPELPEEDEKPSPVVKLIPVDADVLVAMATVENYLSFRHTTDGTWFMQSVCKQLKEGCPSGDDLITILLRVNNEVSQKEGKMKTTDIKQMSEVTKVTLRKKLVFSPMSN